jgi:Rrf2 family protein
MIRISTRARYALRLMVDVARHSSANGPVSLASASKRTDISRSYLEQVALVLRSASLLRGVYGRRGGYHLAVPATEITVGRIFEALIGPTCLVDCVDDPASCPRSDYCECRVIYRMMNEKILEVLQGHTLADLIDPEWVSTHGVGVFLGGEDQERVEGFGCNPTSGDRPTNDRR